MTDEPLTINYDMTLVDLAGITDHFWRVNREYRSSACRIAIVAFIVLCVIGGLASRLLDSVGPAVILGGVGVYCLIALPRATRKRLYRDTLRRYRNDASGMFVGPRTMRFDGDKVYVETAKASGHTHISAFGPVYQSPEAIYIYVGPQTVHAVPHRCTSPEQRQALLARFPQHVLHDDKGRMLKLHADANQMLEGMSDEQLLRQYLYRYNPRCPTCGYGLFLLQSSTCPECGTPLWLTVTSVMPGGLTFMGRWLTLILALTVASTSGVLLTLMLAVTGRLYYGGPLHRLTAAFLLLTPIPTVVFATMHPLRSRDGGRWKAIRVMTVFLLLMIVGAIIAMGTLYTPHYAGVTP
jgi:hypothetical protein